MTSGTTPIHIAFGINDAYAPYISVTIKSIVENNRGNDIRIHVLTDRISNSNQRRLADAVEGCKSAKLEIHTVDDSFLNGLKTGVWTIYTWYRVLLPSILPIEVKKVLYLDADTLVTTDLRELFSVDMTEKSIAATVDIQSFDKRAFERCGYEQHKQYICTGVLLMNLEYWRKNGLAETLVDWANSNSERIMFPDQDAINYVCRDTKIILPLRFGILNAFFENDVFYTERYSSQLRDCIEHPGIIHYAGCYPWIKIFATHPMNEMYMKYNKMLRHSVVIEWIPRKWLYVKVLLWQLLHPSRKSKNITLDDVKRRLSEYEYDA